MDKCVFAWRKNKLLLLQNIASKMQNFLYTIWIIYEINRESLDSVSWDSTTLMLAKD